MNDPLISVIIPSFNRPDFLREAVKSVLAQTYENFELLILDNCSPDHTPDIITSFRDPRIKYLRHQCNIGGMANWYYGIQWAYGKYLSILGDDDRYRPEFLSHRMRLFSRNRDIVAATGAFECCDANGDFLRFSRIPAGETAVLEGTELVKFAIGTNGEWFNGATLYRADLIRSLWEKAVMAGKVADYSLHMRLALMPSSRVAFTPEADILYRFHKGQDSVANTFDTAEWGAKLALQMWKFELKAHQGDYLSLFRKRFVEDVNHYARMLWDKGCVNQARAMFMAELSMDPIRIKTWLRLLRSYLIRKRQNQFIHRFHRWTQIKSLSV